MTFILRWPAILVLLALVGLSALGALAVAAALTGVDTGIAQVQSVQAEAAEAGAAQNGWIDVALWGAATILFLISAIRLMRRTQGFWSWLLGFAAYGGRWAWAQQQEGGLVATVQGADINAYRQPQALLGDLTSVEAQVGVLAIIVIVGLVIFVVDAADRSYWDRQGG